MFKTTKKLIIAFFIIVGTTVALSFVLAGGVDVGLDYGEAIGLSATDPRIIIARIIQIILGFLGILAVGLIIYAGFLWMTAAGNEDNIDRAKQIIKSAIIGLVIVLSAFAITTFLLSRILDATGAGKGSVYSDGGSGGGIGVLGVCTVESVYPEPNQKEVVRNTSIMITFKEEIDSATVCNDANNNNHCDNGETILTDGRIKIYKSKDDPSSFITDLRVYDTIDRKTFVFAPNSFLGSPSEYLWYTAYISNDILKADGKPVFDSCRFDFMEWQFEVSNKIDLIPPQVRESGVFPSPDNGRDVIVTEASPAKARGAVIINNMPRIYSPASVSAVRRNGTSPNVAATADKNCPEEGTFNINVLQDGITAQLSIGRKLLGTERFSNREISFAGYLDLSADADISAGYSWEVDVISEKQADTITLGRNIYIFVDNSSLLPNEIRLGANINETATNIASVLNGNSDVEAQAAGNRINLETVLAGKTGNNIYLGSSRDSVLQTISFSGGTDRSEKVTVNDKKDKPMNSVIQINFNEAVLPIVVSGNASDVANYIRVVNARNNPVPENGACVNNADCASFNCVNNICAGSNNYLSGKFVVSNQYKTVEFISDNQCGVNGCGEPIFCLPENSNLRVEIMAASLVTCNSASDCEVKVPYRNCPNPGTRSCQDDEGMNYPTANINLMNGVMDVAFNSLDGNRNSNAEGPINFYNENAGNISNGDNFSWSFFINDKMETTPPIIESTLPGLGGYNNLLDPLKINFNRLMMSSSLVTGKIDSLNGNERVSHKALNVWSLGNTSIGYWTGKEDVDFDSNGEMDKTTAVIKHSMFSESVSYRAQTGSGLRDIYQNCFKPSSGPACAGVNSVSDNNPSCCNGTATAGLGAEGNCQ